MPLSPRERSQPGLAKISTSRVAICSIVRNCGPRLRRNSHTLDRIASEFGSAHIFVYENGSLDSTPAVLQEWAERFGPNFYYRSDHGEVAIDELAVSSKMSRPGYRYDRIAKIAECRNRCTDLLRSTGLSFDYIVVTDLDFYRLDVSGFFSSFSVDIDWDCITANGLLATRNGMCYYDTFALRQLGDLHPQTVLKMSRAQRQFALVDPRGPLIPVRSSFGGLAIFKGMKLTEARYRWACNEDPEVQSVCEHETLIHDLNLKHVYINPKMRLWYDTYISRLLSKLGLL